MIRRSFLAALVAALASFPATLAAVALYLLLVLGEPLSADLFGSAFFFGAASAVQGSFLAALLGSLLFLIRLNVSRSIFVGIAVVASAIVAAGFGALHFGSPHVSHLLAAMLMASTWGITAGALAFVQVRAD